MPGIRSIAVFFYSNTMRSLETLIITESFKISRQLLHALSNKLLPCNDRQLLHALSDKLLPCNDRLLLLRCPNKLHPCNDPMVEMTGTRCDF